MTQRDKYQYTYIPGSNIYSLLINNGDKFSHTDAWAMLEALNKKMAEHPVTQKRDEFFHPPIFPKVIEQYNESICRHRQADVSDLFDPTKWAAHSTFERAVYTIDPTAQVVSGVPRETCTEATKVCERLLEEILRVGAPKPIVTFDFIIFNDLSSTIVLNLYTEFSNGERVLMGNFCTLSTILSLMLENVTEDIRRGLNQQLEMVDAAVRMLVKQTMHGANKELFPFKATQKVEDGLVVLLYPVSLYFRDMYEFGMFINDHFFCTHVLGFINDIWGHYLEESTYGHNAPTGHKSTSN